MTQQTSSTTASLRDIYLTVFDEFALDTGDVAQAYGISHEAAYKLLSKLRRAGLVDAEVVNGHSGPRTARSNGGAPNPGKQVTWQSYQTYDSISHEEAEALFDAAFPAKKETKVAKKSSTPKLSAADTAFVEGAAAALDEVPERDVNAEPFVSFGEPQPFRAAEFGFDEMETPDEAERDLQNQIEAEEIETRFLAGQAEREAEMEAVLLRSATDGSVGADVPVEDVRGIITEALRDTGARPTQPKAEPVVEAVAPVETRTGICGMCESRGTVVLSDAARIDLCAACAATYAVVRCEDPKGRGQASHGSKRPTVIVLNKSGELVRRCRECIRKEGTVKAKVEKAAKAVREPKAKVEKAPRAQREAAPERVEPGTVLRATVKGVEYVCTVERNADGTLAYVMNGTRYTSASAAGQAAKQAKSCGGWGFWLGRGATKPVVAEATPAPAAKPARASRKARSEMTEEMAETK